MTPHVLANAKAYAALVGAICTGLLGVFAADTIVGQILTVASIIATAVATWRVPNLDPAGDRQAESVQPPDGHKPILGKAFYGRHRNDAGRADVLYILAVILIAVLILAVLAPML